ncbi:MAG: group II intron reverse transcriptase/maturase [Gemmatimonadales bacterium]
MALENGVKGGCWFSLIDKVASEKGLRAAFATVERNGGAAGVDHVTVERFAARLDENIGKLSRSLLDRTYRPQAIRRQWIPKAGSKEKRPLGIPTVRDRVVQTALRNVVEPIFERDFADTSYGFRPGRGCHDALREVEELLNAGHTWVVDADLQSFFDTVSHEVLLERVREKVSDGRVLRLIEAFLAQEVMDGMKGWMPEEGTPQGAVISPLLSNIYLDPLDHRMAELGIRMIRYADDFVLLCRSEHAAREALEQVRAWTEEVSLRLHPEKTRIVDATERGGFDFLGYHFERGYKWPREKSIQKLKDTVRERTKRKNGQSLAAIITELNRLLGGWFTYFQYSHPTTFPRLDSWVRMRLRSILRKRERREGVGTGWDNRRWPNRYFIARGLFSLVTAHEAIRQSSSRGTTDRRAGCGRSARPVRRGEGLAH